MKGQSMTEIKNNILASIVGNPDIIKALVIGSNDFLGTTPTTEQQTLINNPDELIRTQIYPYKKVVLETENAIPYITMGFYNFKKIDAQYKQGTVYFYVIIPQSIEKTKYGMRYDYICDKLEELFSDIGIGKFEYYDRSDILDIGNSLYVGSYVAFTITDFHGN